MEYASGMKNCQFKIIKVDRHRLDFLFDIADQNYGVLKNKTNQVALSSISEINKSNIVIYQSQQ